MQYCKTYIHQAEARRRVCRIWTPAVEERSGRATRVDEELVHVFKGVKLVSATPAQYVNIQPIGLGQ